MGEQLNRTTTFPFVAAVLVALLVVALGIQSRTSSVQPVQQALIGGTEAKRQGPWPACLGIAGSECKHLIESYAEDLRGNVFIIDPDMMVTADFDTTRVRIYVDESSIVIQIPKRG